MLLLILLSIAIFQGVIIGTILLKSPFFKNKASQYLGLSILSLSLSWLNLVLDITNTYEPYPFLRIIDILDSGVLFPVFLLIYVSYQVGNPINRSEKHWLFAPYFISTLYSILEEFNTNIDSSDLINPFNVFTTIISIIIFFILLYFIPIVLIRTYKYIQQSKKEQEKKWLTYLWVFEVTFLVTWVFLIFLALFDEEKISNAINILAVCTTLVVHWIGYFGIYKLKLMNEQEKIRALLFYRPSKTVSPSVTSPSAPIKTTTEKESSKPAEDNKYFQTLERLCAEEKIYRDSSLDRNKVAEILGISPSYVSLIINSITGENFSSYINRYRVEDVKVLILDKDFENYSLLAIGLECGFSSKTTYYNSFKKITGMTPNAFREAHQ